MSVCESEARVVVLWVPDVTDVLFPLLLWSLSFVMVSPVARIGILWTRSPFLFPQKRPLSCTVKTSRGTHPTEPERAHATRAAWWQAGAKRHEELRENRAVAKTGLASLHHVNLVAVSVLGPTGERQGHLDAIVAFAVLNRAVECSESCGPRAISLKSVDFCLRRS